MSKLHCLLSGTFGVRPPVSAVVVSDKFLLIVLKVRMCVKLVVCKQSSYQQLPAVSDLRQNSPGSL